MRAAGRKARQLVDLLPSALVRERRAHLGDRGAKLGSAQCSSTILAPHFN